MPKALTEYEKYQLGSTRPDSDVQGSEVIYKTSVNEGIWPIIAALGEAVKTSIALEKISQSGIFKVKNQGFDLITVLY